MHRGTFGPQKTAIKTWIAILTFINISPLLIPCLDIILETRRLLYDRVLVPLWVAQNIRRTINDIRYVRNLLAPLVNPFELIIDIVVEFIVPIVVDDTAF